VGEAAAAVPLSAKTSVSSAYLKRQTTSVDVNEKEAVPLAERTLPDFRSRSTAFGTKFAIEVDLEWMVMVCSA